MQIPAGDLAQFTELPGFVIRWDVEVRLFYRHQLPVPSAPALPAPDESEGNLQLVSLGKDQLPNRRDRFAAERELGDVTGLRYSLLI